MITEDKIFIGGYHEKDAANCKSPVCRINDNVPHIEMSHTPATGCLDVEQCVTMVIKTRKRINMTATMVKSIIKYYPTVSILVVDDIIFNDTDQAYEDESLFPDMKPLFDLKLPSKFLLEYLFGLLSFHNEEKHSEHKNTYFQSGSSFPYIPFATSFRFF